MASRGFVGLAAAFHASTFGHRPTTRSAALAEPCAFIASQKGETALTSAANIALGSTAGGKFERASKYCGLCQATRARRATGNVAAVAERV